MIRLAGGPVSWGVDFADDPANPPYTQVLDGLEAAGLRYLELGPAGYLPPAALEGRPLHAIGTFVFEDLQDRTATLSATVAALDAIAATNGELLVVIDRPSPERAHMAGDGARAPRLGERAFARLAGVVTEVAERAVLRGVSPVLHPHAGGHIEFDDEIDRVLDATGIALCLDTGHALYAGGDPAELIARHPPAHVHLKDLDPAIHARGLPFWEAVRAGVFCPIGDGALDLEQVRDALAGYDGYATIEQDRRADSPGSPADDLRRSVERFTASPRTPS
jgi:inosose dehydratase